jgi:Gas vesicle synthesis protein GvpO
VRPGKLLEVARKQVHDVAGVEPETVSGLVADDDHGWVVTVEAVELARVPNTMDLMGTYEVNLSQDGELLGFRRVGRYQRAAL